MGPNSGRFQMRCSNHAKVYVAMQSSKMLFKKLSVCNNVCNMKMHVGNLTT